MPGMRSDRRSSRALVLRIEFKLISNGQKVPKEIAAKTGSAPSQAAIYDSLMSVE